MQRCKWAMAQEHLQRYHDGEWGRPSHDDRHLFELLVLESFQAGLSWLTVLKKREAFVRAFDGFDPALVAGYGEEKIQALLQDASIIRSRRKIEAAINNARVFLEIQREFGSFARFIWQFTGGRVIKHQGGEIPVSTPLSDRVSAELKRRGMRFVGTVIVYSYLGAIGVVNDHEPGCDLY